MANARAENWRVLRAMRCKWAVCRTSRQASQRGTRVRGPTHSKIRTVLQSRDFKLAYKKIKSRASATEYIRLIPVKQMKQVHFLGPRVLQ